MGCNHHKKCARAPAYSYVVHYSQIVLKGCNYIGSVDMVQVQNTMNGNEWMKQVETLQSMYSVC